MAGIMTVEKYCSTQYANEKQFTSATNMFISHNYEELRGLYYHIPNESATSDLMRMTLFSMGVNPGVPDFRFELPRPSGFYLELKIGDGRLSPKQKALHEKWKRHGIEIYVCWIPEQVVKLLEHKFGKAKFAA